MCLESTCVRVIKWTDPIPLSVAGQSPIVCLIVGLRVLRLCSATERGRVQQGSGIVEWSGGGGGHDVAGEL